MISVPCWLFVIAVALEAITLLLFPSCAPGIMAITGCDGWQARRAAYARGMPLRRNQVKEFIGNINPFADLFAVGLRAYVVFAHCKRERVLF